jgi:hypothetical protein
MTNVTLESICTVDTYPPPSHNRPNLPNEDVDDENGHLQLI